MNRNEKILIFINALYFIAGTMSSVFVNVYLYAFTGSIYAMTAYAMVRFGFFPVGFAIGGKTARRTSLSTSLTIGLVIIVIALATLLGINQAFAQNVSLIYLLGVIFGLGEGMYWFSINNLNLVASSKATRPAFISTMGIFNAAATVVAPFVATLIVRVSATDLDGYIRIFQVVIILQTIAAALSTRVKVEANKKPYTLLDKFKLKTDPQWRYIMISHFLLGARDSLLLVLSGLLIYKATGGSGSQYGDLLTFFAVLSIVSNFAASRLIKRHNRIKMYIFGAILLFSSTMILVLVPNLYGAIYFGVVNALGNPFFINPFSIITMNAMSDYMDAESVYGRMIVKEVSMDAGRLTGMASTLVMAIFFKEPLSLILSVTFCSSFTLILVAYAHLYHRERDRSNPRLLRK